MSFFYNLGKGIMPESFRGKIKGYMQKTGKTDVPYSQYGMIFILTIIMTIVLYFFFIFKTLSTSNIAFMVITTFILLTFIELGFCLVGIIGFWLHYEFIIFKRTREIEEVLPDFLEQVSINLRSGMSFDKALWNSIMPEFGVLEKEIEIVAKRVMAGEDTETALTEFAEKYNSTLLQESMDMIIVGLKSGGNISELIDKIVRNVKEASFLNRELIASVTSYVIFIGVISVAISPVLFALSFNLMQIIQGLGSKLSSSSSYGVLSINFGNKLNPADFILFSKICVIIISGISSLIIADLREGSIKAGMKYIFIFIPLSYVIYLAMLTLLSGFFAA